MRVNKLQRIHERLRTDLEFFSAKNYKIKPKEGGGLIPFDFNRSQQHAHAMIEQQIKRIGMVRAYIVKGRQQGMSTYVSGRYQHHCQYIENIETFILAHRDDATKNLYGISKRFRDNLPAVITPKLDKDTQEKTIYTNGSSYSLGTAASVDVGRSMNVQRFHGSEVAFWKNADGLQEGIMQTIGLVPGTEIIFESTARGPKGMFHQGVKDVLSGLDKLYIVIFIPWYWEYWMKLPMGYDFKIEDDEEAMLVESYNLTPEHLYWRRIKIISELKKPWKFKQEYPSNIAEAFQTSGDGLIDARMIVKAMKATIRDDDAPLVLGVDPARTGDRTTIIARRGRVVPWYKKYDSMNNTKLAGILIKMINEKHVRKIFIDFAYGTGVYDIMKELGYGKFITLVHFNESPLDEDRFVNKRAELWYLAKEWIEDDGVSIPDDEVFQADLMSAPEEMTTSNSKIQMVSKKQIKKEFGMSPDILDGLGLTFAFPVKRDLPGESNEITKVKTGTKRPNSPLTTLNRHRKTKRRSSGIRPK